MKGFVFAAVLCWPAAPGSRNRAGPGRGSACRTRDGDGGPPAGLPQGGTPVQRRAIRICRRPATRQGDNKNAVARRAAEDLAAAQSSGSTSRRRAARRSSRSSSTRAQGQGAGRHRHPGDFRLDRLDPRRRRSAREGRLHRDCARLHVGDGVRTTAAARNSASRVRQREIGKLTEDGQGPDPERRPRPTR